MNDCDDKQTILKLSNDKVAKAGLYNHSNYRYDICLNQIFDDDSPGNPHECTGDPEDPDNIVLWLNDTGYASSTKQGSFNIPVCYGDLRCELEAGPGYSDWWNSNFIKRKKINISGSTIDLADFPVYLRIPYESDMQNDYNDLRFINESGDELNYEIDVYDVISAHVFVRIPNLASGDDANTIYMYYGNPIAENGENPEGVWDGDYVGVWHMTEQDINDSTKNNIDGTAVGGVSLVSRGSILEFDGTSGYIDVGDIDSYFGTEATLAMYLKLDNDQPTVGGGGGPVDFGRHRFVYENYYGQVYPYTNGELYIHTFRNDRIGGINDGNFDKSQWHMLSVINKPGVLDYSIYQNKRRIYFSNGEPVITLRNGNEIIGRTNSIFGTYYFDGQIEEIRLSNISRSKEYLDYQLDIYQNQTGFVKIGDEENPSEITEDSICSSGRNLVLRLASESPDGSLVSIAEFSYYNYGICCSNFIGIRGANWKSMNDELINQTTLNSLVKMEISGGSFDDKEFNYNVYQTCSGLSCIAEFFFGAKEIASSSSEGYTIWRAGKKGDDLESGNYYFKAYPTDYPSEITDSRYVNGVDNTEGLNPYGVLKVKGPEVNIPPFANITGPYNKQIYFLGEVLKFTQNSYDEDDGFTYEWRLGDGMIKTGDSETRVNYNFSYAYNITGQKDISLIVTDDRGRVARDQISILIINSTYMMAYIDEPLFGQIINQRYVNFNASSTYAVSSELEADSVTRNITCLAGNCPSETAGCPPPQTGCHIEIRESPANPFDSDYSEVEFNWSFYDENFQFIGEKIVLGNPNTGIEFAYSDDYIVRLITSINPSSSAESGFFVNFAEDIRPRCILLETQGDVDDFLELNGEDIQGNVAIGQSYWETTDSVVRADDSTSSCYNENGIGDDLSGDNPRCCVESKDCDTGTGLCVASSGGSPGGGGGNNVCGNFRSESTCSGKKLVAERVLRLLGYECGRNSQVFGADCTHYTKCDCVWDGTNCNEVAKNMTLYGDREYEKGDDNYPSVCADSRATCVYSTSGDCVEGEDYFTLNSTLIDGGTDCISVPSKNVECPNKVKLSFFGIVNLIIAVLVIFFIYYLIRKKGKK